jgi:DNA-binding transcriptional MerR regulator
MGAGGSSIMRISELSRRSRVPVATIKFYLRERLLHEGRLTAATQASYDETHLARVELIRALTGPGGLSLARTRAVLELIDSSPEPTIDLLGCAHAAVARPPADEPALDDVDDLLGALGWSIGEENRELRAEVADALRAIRVADFALPEGGLERYAQLMLDAATMEIDNIPTDSAEAAVRYVVLGTVLIEPLLLALRRLAQQEASKRRFAARPEPPEDRVAEVGNRL